MNTKGIITAIVTIIVGVILTTGILIPIIGDATGGGEEYTNENPTIKFVKVTENPSVNMDVIYVENTHVLTLNSNDYWEVTLNDQGQAIVYVDNNVIVYIEDSNLCIITKATGEVTTVEGGAISTAIYQHDDVVDIGDDYQSPVPTWAYIPDSTGTYGFYPTGAEITTNNDSVTIQGIGTLTAISGTTESNVSPTIAAILSVIPLIVIVGLLIATVTMFIKKQ